jgi:hypothetical protein
MQVGNCETEARILNKCLGLWILVDLKRSGLFPSTCISNDIIEMTLMYLEYVTAGPEINFRVDPGPRVGS